jgi:hypothetical protein
MSENTVELYTAQFEAGLNALPREKVASVRALGEKHGVLGLMGAQRCMHKWERWYFATPGRAYSTLYNMQDPGGGVTSKFMWFEEEVPWHPGGRKTTPAEASWEWLLDLLDILDA